MSLFETVPIDAGYVSLLVHDRWSIELGTLIKASQNHTFHGTLRSRPVFVRVTPDPTGEHQSRIDLEVSMLCFLHEHYPQLNVCPTVATQDGTSTHIVVDDARHLIVVVFEHAKGEPVIWNEFKWFRDPELVRSWGRWLGQFHIASRAFAASHPELAARARSWRELHKAIMANHPVHPDDEAAAADPTRYGLIHGDVNCSNFFYIPPQTASGAAGAATSAGAVTGAGGAGALSVFDWDQVQRGWFLYDLAQGIFGAVILAGAGSLDGTRVEVNVESFTDGLVAGYESVDGITTVDRQALSRMIHIKKTFYYLFCSRAVVELEGDEERAGMRWFCKFVSDWFEKEGFNKNNK